MLMLAGACLVMALVLGRVVLDPPQVTDAPAGGLGALFRIPGFWLVLPFMLVSYAPVAGIRALWAGPYFAQVFGADARAIGYYTLAIGLAMILGTLLDELERSDKETGLATLCIGSGMGAATIIERV